MHGKINIDNDFEDVDEDESEHLDEYMYNNHDIPKNSKNPSHSNKKKKKVDDFSDDYHNHSNMVDIIYLYIFYYYVML